VIERIDKDFVSCGKMETQELSEEMGNYLNRGYQDFLDDRDMIPYVDMSGMISLLNRRISRKQRYLCVSRPRRFGKTTMVNMLKAYYDCSVDSSKAFEGLEITKDTDPETGFLSHLNRYHVISLDMASICASVVDVEEAIRKMEAALLREITRETKGIRENEQFMSYVEIGDMSSALMEFMNFTNRRIVFLIDEWDFLFRAQPDDSEGLKRYQRWLSGILKSKTYVALVYMTGIFPVKTYGSTSVLNMITEVSVADAMEFARYTGFTDDQVRALCEQYDCSYDDMKTWYDGYTVNGISIYNPNSIANAVSEGLYKSYWSLSETFENLKDYVTLDIGGLRSVVMNLLSGISAHVNMELFTFRNSNLKSVNSVLSALVHLGYLTFEKNVEDSVKNDCLIGFVSIPNKEVRMQFENCVSADQDLSALKTLLDRSESLLDAVMKGDEDTVAAKIGEAHERFTSVIHANDENSLACVLNNAFYTAAANYDIYNEFPTGKGFADLAFLPKRGNPNPAMLVELKYNQDAYTAIDQIKRKNYHGRLLESYGDVILVGINYDKNDRSKPYTCRIERVSLK